MAARKPIPRPPKPQLAPPIEHVAHPLSYDGGIWRCPITGYVVQKGLTANIAQRRGLIELADADPNVRALLIQACRRSFLLWVNLFVRTYRQHEVLPDGSQRPVEKANVPMITWPVQDFAAGRILAAIFEGRDILIDKSRDMGATWLCLLVLMWLWLFHDDSSFKVLSRKESEVDKPDDPDTLFFKLRFTLQNLPAWMRPTYGDRSMQISNQANGSVITGESTNADAGRGGRRKAVLLDECSAYDNLEEIERATHQATTCRIYNATPKGPGKYSDLRFSGRVEVVVLGFWDHPEKGRGRYLKVEDGRVRWSSPWRDLQLASYDQRTVAQNIDIDHERAGAMFFDSAVLSMQQATYAVIDAVLRGDIVCRLTGADRDEAIRNWKPGGVQPWSFRPNDRGALRLWGPLIKLPNGQLRPRQDRVWVSGWDISMGTGASNSAGFFFDKDGGDQFGEWCSATVDPAELARLAAMLGYWFGGMADSRPGCAYLAWENNGGGGAIFTRNVRSLGYAWLHHHVRRKGDIDELTDTLGWTSSKENKLDVLGEFRSAMGMGRIKVRSKETLREAGRYVFFRNGEIGPATLEAQGQDARTTHGDRLIAAAVAWEGSLRCDRVPMPRIVPPVDSVLARRRRGLNLPEAESIDDTDMAAGEDEDA